MEKSVSRAGNWRRDARITFNTTEAVQRALGCLAANIDSFLKVFDGDKGHPGTPLQ